MKNNATSKWKRLSINIWFYNIILLQNWYFIIIKSNSSYFTGELFFFFNIFLPVRWKNDQTTQLDVSLIENRLCCVLFLLLYFSLRGCWCDFIICFSFFTFCYSYFFFAFLFNNNNVTYIHFLYQFFTFWTSSYIMEKNVTFCTAIIYILHLD